MTDDLFKTESLLPARAKSAAYLNKPRNYEALNSASFVRKEYNNDETFYTPRSCNQNFFDSDSFYNSKNDFGQGQSNVYDLVKNRNASERIQELERTNMKLKKMLNYASIDKLNLPDTPRIIETDRSIRENLLGPPVLRQGRIGSSWRHIKQTNNYSNSNLLFVDGTVRIDDSARYPPRMYGYPPKASFTSRQLSARHHRPQDRNEEIIGLGARSMTELDLPINSIVKSRPLNLSPYENKYQQRAKEGFEYWTKDRRYQENNKPKAKLYTTGAYKTFHGLSDALLKT